MEGAEQRPARGEVGQRIYEEVGRLVAGEARTRKAAFERICERTGRRVEAISANYDWVARVRGRGRRRHAVRSVNAPAGGRRKRRTVAALIDQHADAIRALVTLVREQEAELVRLRADNARVSELRRLLEPATGQEQRSRRGGHAGAD